LHLLHLVHPLHLVHLLHPSVFYFAFPVSSLKHENLAIFAY